jgi:phosphate-selective porin
MKTKRSAHRPPARRLFPAIAALCLVPAAFAQSVESDLTPEAELQAQDADAYALPDFGDKTLAAAQIVDEKDRFSVKLGFAFLPADYTFFDQDAESITQVGEQEDQYEVRSLRFMARGHFEFLRKWNYMVSYEYKGFDKTADAANLPHSERLLSPFFISRNNGISLSNTMLDQRASWTVGGYWGTGTDATARVTALPMISESGNEYLHVGASVRYYAGDDNKLRFKGKPASNVASNYVDTGTLAADHAWNTGLEVLWAKGGYSLLGEYITSSVRSESLGTPRFDGWYLTAGWVLSGEHRPYDRKAGYARRVQPKGRWGALEAVAHASVASISSMAASTAARWMAIGSA